MAVWLVRAGRDGSREHAALSGGFACIGFSELGDLGGVTSRDQIRDRFTAIGDRAAGAVNNHTAQVWAFRDSIAIGDIIALPLKGSPAVALGRVTSDYYHVAGAEAGMRHRRNVEWIRDDTPRAQFGQDLLYSLGAFLTVCRIQRNEAESRIAALMAGRPDPGFGKLIGSSPTTTAGDAPDSDDAVALDLERYGRDRIGALISQRFAGHQLTELVAAILRAEGYHTLVSPPGPDGGVDILAGTGPMGFDAPRVCVQVKTGECDAPMLRDLQGTMHNVGASHGLFVAWAGFKRTVREEQRRTFFSIRLWDSDELISRLVSVYDRLPAEVREDLPLKQVWTVVEDDTSETTTA